MVRVVSALRDPSSQLLPGLQRALEEGRLCVVDISQMRGAQGLALAGVILQELFEGNQAEFTKKDSRSVPVIAVVEEAQSVLGATAAQGEGPFVAWVKEGRKYDLGAMLITQQPGSIPQEILSQGDNWFVFHLLSEGDLRAVRKANAHFSDDLLSSLLNEPIPGHGVFWSSAGETPYPIPIRANPPIPSNRRSTATCRVLKRYRVAGRPVLPRMDLAAQRRRTMSRCQRRIVSGATSSRSPWRRAFGITLSRVARSARSVQFSFGRRGCRRCRTVSWWRRIKISAVFHVSSRRDGRSHVASRMIRRNKNPQAHDRRSSRAERLASEPAGQSRGRDSRHVQVQADPG